MAPPVAWSTAWAVAPSLRPSPTAMTRVAVFRVSGRALLTRNSILGVPGKALNGEVVCVALRSDRPGESQDNAGYFRRLRTSAGGDASRRLV
ncbi:hypothetical protein D3C76_1307710 [compost metagenome]